MSQDSWRNSETLLADLNLPCLRVTSINVKARPVAISSMSRPEQVSPLLKVNDAAAWSLLCTITATICVEARMCAILKACMLISLLYRGAGMKHPQIKDLEKALYLNSAAAVLKQAEAVHGSLALASPGAFLSVLRICPVLAHTFDCFQAQHYNVREEPVCSPRVVSRLSSWPCCREENDGIATLRALVRVKALESCSCLTVLSCSAQQDQDG